jgi:thioredoxin reductase (NADPH)
VVFEDEAGGEPTLTTEVKIGFPQGILGPELMDSMRKQAERFGAKCMMESVTAVDFSKRPFKITAGDTVIEADSFIIASGASAKMLGIESERLLLGHGVSTCATCDGFFHKDRDLIVVGGGDSALEEATFLTKFASRVSIVHRRGELRASKIPRTGR